MFPKICKHFGIGEPMDSPVRVDGGLMNLMWRLETQTGLYAIKQLLLWADRDNRLPSETGEFEVGYILAKAYWGRGLGTELLRGLLDYGFSKLGATHIVAVCHLDNLASIRIMEKCGMTFVGEVLLPRHK